MEQLFSDQPTLRGKTVLKANEMRRGVRDHVTEDAIPKTNRTELHC